MFAVLPHAARQTDWKKVGVSFGAMALAVLAQGTDRSSGLHGFTPLFFLAAMLPATGTESAYRIPASAILCALLASMSIAVSDFAGRAELLSSWATIAIAAASLTSDQKIGFRLAAAVDELDRQGRRFKTIFELSPVALWEQDFTGIAKHLEAVKNQGVADLGSYARDNPAFGAECARLISTKAVNQAAVEMLGASSQEELLGGLQPFIPDGDILFIEALQAFLDGRERYEGLARLVGPGGQVRTAYVAIRFPSSECGIDRVIVGMIDVTERQRILSELRETQAALATAKRLSEMGALSATIAHELSQPVSAVMMNAQTALKWLRDRGDISSARNSLEMIIRDARRAGDILEATRSRLSPFGSVQQGTVGVQSLVEETAQLMEEELSRANVRLEVRLRHGAAEIAGPRIELQQVLVNLISNAIHALADVDVGRRRIHLTTSSTDDGAVTFRIADHGPGIPDIAADRLFAPLFTTKANGMGMGLAIARGTIERCGGRIVAYNRSDGAVFEFSLPAVVPSSEETFEEAAG